MLEAMRKKGSGTFCAKHPAGRSGKRYLTAFSVTARIRPEHNLLLYCSRTHINGRTAEVVAALVRDDIDWEYFLRTAHRHGIMPLLHWGLNTNCATSIPQHVREQLRDYFHANARRNLFLTGALFRLLKVFEAHRITAIPFKGPTLAACAYGNLALRQFNDLDILLCKQDVPKAKELLIAEGYHLPFRLNAAQEGAYLQSLGQLPFVREDGSFVELHSGLTPRDFSFRLHAESLSERLVPVFVGGKQVLTLSPEDLLLILCVHGAKHVWACLGWICDVAELIYSHHAMDWARVLDQARMLRSERMLFLGLFLASVLLGATLPAPILQRALADPWIKPLAAQVCEQLFRRDGHLCEADGLGQALFHVRVRESWLDGVRYCLSLAVAPTLADWTLLRLPRCLSAAYYLLRAIRLAAKYTLSGRRGLGV